jgi:hypothetical protein
MRSTGARVKIELKAYAPEEGDPLRWELRHILHEFYALKDCKVVGKQLGMWQQRWARYGWKKDEVYSNNQNSEIRRAQKRKQPGSSAAAGVGKDQEYWMASRAILDSGPRLGTLRRKPILCSSS